MRKYLLLAVILSANYFSGFTQTSSQTRTATLFNDIDESYIDSWIQEGPEYLSADDNSYAYTRKLSGARSNAILLLQGFGFDIPGDATIQNINVKARRFKTGKGSIMEYFASLVREHPLILGSFTGYGVRWADPNFFSTTETEVTYSQSGSGSNGGGNNLPYQWTSGIINNPLFGIEFEVYAPTKGPVVIYYDLVEITVEYSQPVTIAGRSSTAAEVKPLKAPIVYPNPFTTKTNIQFTASESGRASVELYNIAGIKIRTLFSGSVVEGGVYNTSFGDALLANGIYVYTISNGKQKHTGKIIKLE
jgi:hypothetical protein